MLCENKVAIVTGAAGEGMGRSIALTLAREGANVVLNYRTSEENAKQILFHIQDRGGKAYAVKADVFTEEGCKVLVEETRASFGQIDILVVNPGAGWHPAPPDTLDANAALDDVRQELAPFYYLLPLVLPEMYERRWGRIIGISLAPPWESPSYAYDVGKIARAGALWRMRKEAWEHGVTVNIIAPGPVASIETFENVVGLYEHGKA